KQINGKRYVFVDSNKTGIVWRNVIAFIIAFRSMFVKLMLLPCKAFFYGLLSGIGIVCGCHRLWAHRSYKATLLLRIFYMLCQTAAGQNDIYIWSRDHRLHHKFSDTDADPHNSKRGMFFCHMGWLLTRKHPDVMVKGATLDCSDLLDDSVVKFQRRFFLPLASVFTIYLPTVICHSMCDISWFDALTIAGIGRYVIFLHITWFVNSAAHLFGDRPYNEKISPRENDQ
ncbi:acyl-CoA desaturase-like protein, partial [Leptotrombidium deliense]